MDIDAYRARAQAFATDLNRAHHRRFAGLDGAWDPESLYAHHAAVYDDAAIEALRALAEREEPEGGEQGATQPARRLLRFAVEARLGRATAPTDALRARAEAAAGLAELTAALAAEPDLGRRVALEEERLDVVTRSLTPPAAEGLERVRAEARALGWPSPRALLATVHGRDPGALAAEAEALLRATDAPQLDGGDPQAGGPATARFDLPRVHRAAWADPLLPADPVAHLRRALGRLGLDDGRFAIDAAPRAGKSPRAFCAAVHVPGDVHLVVAGRDGLAALEAVFHEAGHAVHLSHRDPAAPFEDRHLVDRADAEALAFALEARATDGIDDQRLAAHRDALARLRTRQLAAALLHDLDLLDAGPDPALRERYARRMATATGLTWPSAPWLVVADPLLSSADYLRALARARPLAGDDDALAAALTSSRP
jgi:hypothetical protein